MARERLTKARVAQFILAAGIVEGLGHAKQELQAEVLRAARSPSRSTCPYTNAIEAERTAALAELLADVTAMGSQLTACQGDSASSTVFWGSLIQRSPGIAAMRCSRLFIYAAQPPPEHKAAILLH